LGAGGLEFKSPRPDQLLNELAILHIPDDLRNGLAEIIFAIFLTVTVNSFISRFPEARGITISVSWFSVAPAFIISCSTRLLFGYLPANRAAKLGSMQALRCE
jgi:ABC-type lipoprotein release transport system permease subunit